MSFFNDISALGIIRCWGGLPFLFVLTLVVFFHELGHFLLARLCGVRVSVFSVGFGPELFGFSDPLGTRWKLSLIPLGGYVKFFGDDNAASAPDRAALAAMSEPERRQSFVHQPVASRSAIVVAGPAANFLFAVAIFASLFMLFGKPSASPRVDSVQPGSAAAAAGFRPGDVVLTINGRRVESFTDMQRIVSTSAGETLSFEIDRGGARITLKATPALQEVRDSFGNVNRIGILGITRSTGPNDSNVQPVGPLQALVLGAQETWFVVERTLWYLGRVFIGRETADQLGGPIRIAEVSCQVATAGLAALVHLTAILSVSIGLLNLFPIPLLDGGHLLFYAIEAVRGKPLSERAQELGFRIGFAVVVMLMIFTTYNDILRLLPASWRVFGS
jgi:regulator of sigma E protease